MNFAPLVVQKILTLKRLGGGVQFDHPPPCGVWCGFSKIVSSKAWFFVTFDIILRDIFPENFIEFP